MRITSILCILSGILILVLDYYKSNLILKYVYFGGKADPTMYLAVIVGLYCILAVLSVICVFKTFETIKWKSIIPVAAMIIPVLLILFFPYSRAYTVLFYALNKDRLQQTLDSAELEKYYKGDGIYTVPYRFASDMDEIRVLSDSGEVMYFAYNGCGFVRDVLLIYSPHDDLLNRKSQLLDDSLSIGHIVRLDTGWYSATT